MQKVQEINKTYSAQHLGTEGTPSPQCNEMMARGSTTRGSNDPPEPPTTLDTHTDPTYWKNKNKAYILAQLITSGWDPPHPDTHTRFKKLLTIFFRWRNIKPETETPNSNKQTSY
jgi:hypothetical protein